MKHQQEIYNLTTESQKTLNSKMADYEGRILNLEANYKIKIEEKEIVIKDNTKKINSLNVLNTTLENNVHQLKTETSEKSKKINTLESELVEANKIAQNAKSKYESMQDKLEKEFNGKNVIIFLLISNREN
jgi:hypothetical protein